MTEPAKRWTLVATILASSMTFIDGTVVNVALPALQAGLGATITDVQWVMEAYALLLSALILVGGSLGDQLGRKRVFLFGVVFFTAASVVCAAAASPRALIVGRALQGFGAAFLVPGSLAIISATFDDAERGKAIGTWSGFSAITTAIGPVTGGWLIENVSWRAVFIINVPLAIAVVWLTVRHVEESFDPSRTERIDWTGAVLAVASLGGIVYGLLEWPARGLRDPAVVGALVLGVAASVALLIVESLVPNPMLPLKLFRSRTFALTNLLTLLLYGALAVVMFLVPMNLIQVQHYSATAAGAALLPFPIIMFSLSRWSGGLVARVGSRLPLTIGPLISAAGLALNVVPGIGGSYWSTFFPAVVVLGTGMAITVAPLTTTVMGAVEATHAGVASGINNAVSRVAGLLAIAGVGILLARTFDAEARARVHRMTFSPEVKSVIVSELPKMAGASVPAPARPAVDEAFVAAFRAVMVGAAVLAVASAACGAAVR